MKDGRIKVAAHTPKIQVANPIYNGESIYKLMCSSYDSGAKIIVFPELCITGFTCNDLFLQETLLTEAKKTLQKLVESSKGMEALFFVGLPLEIKGKLYNVAAAFNNGKLLAFVPKTNIPNYSEFYEVRHFVSGDGLNEVIEFYGNKIPVKREILFTTNVLEGLYVGCELCEDVWVINPPSTNHVLAGATVIVNLSASNEIVGKDDYRSQLLQSTSARLVSGYIYASAGEGESTQDLVFAGKNRILENGRIIAESKAFYNESIYGVLDLAKIRHERRRMNTFLYESNSYEIMEFDCIQTKISGVEILNKTPFVPSIKEEKEKRCEDILSIQAYGLKKRLEHTGCKKPIIGISGGLDSTLALLVIVKAMDLLKIERKNIYCITMPCFGTTDRTYENACKLTNMLGATLEEIDIKEAVTIHFKDISHDINVHDVTYENGQARERTQILMNIANRENGMVIGTGDMSELALGWATYNGDHMSMYGVNCGVPKTLVRHLVSYYADTLKEESLKEVLYDILQTPVSPELLPPVDGVISQKTEDLVGPYELHDFYLYYMLRLNYSPTKIYESAIESFKEEYSKETIKKWLVVFYTRFFTQQFKRSCMPDGPKVGSVSLSPRGDLRMPSDAVGKIWIEEAKNL
ncbi:MAG: NAD(+) synthase [Lachnospiraceae bacterium]